MRKSHLFFSISFSLLTTFSQAFASENEIKKSITEVKKLYTKALPMAISNPEKMTLLNKAETILNQSINQYPDSLEVHRKLIAVYILEQNYPKAIKTMQSAIQLSPKDPQLFVALATFYQKIGALDLAKEMLNQALILNPKHQVAKDYKVVIQKALDKFDQSINKQAPTSPHNKTNTSSNQS